MEAYDCICRAVNGRICICRKIQGFVAKALARILKICRHFGRLRVARVVEEILSCQFGGQF